MLRIFIVGLLALCAACTGAFAQTHYVANTEPPDAFLSLRSEPSSSSGRRIATMPNGTELNVIRQQQNGWWYVRVVSTGQEGWALSSQSGRQWIECCKTQEAAQTASPEQNIPAIVKKNSSSDSAKWIKSCPHNEEYINGANRQVCRTEIRVQDGTLNSLSILQAVDGGGYLFRVDLNDAPTSIQVSVNGADGKEVWRNSSFELLACATPDAAPSCAWDAELDATAIEAIKSGQVLKVHLDQSAGPQELTVALDGFAAALESKVSAKRKFDSCKIAKLIDGPSANCLSTLDAPLTAERMQVDIEPRHDIAPCQPGKPCINGRMPLPTYRSFKISVPEWSINGDMNCKDRYRTGSILVMLKHNKDTESIFVDSDRTGILLASLAESVTTKCAEATQSPDFHDGIRPIRDIPSAIGIISRGSSHFEFEAHSPGKEGPWTIVTNGPMQRKIQLDQIREEQNRRNLEQERIRQVVIASVEKARQEAPRNSTEDQQIVDALLAHYKNGSCAATYEYVSGEVVGRSVEGLTGVFLVRLIAINKRLENIRPGSIVWECGSPAQSLPPGAPLLLERNGHFRKYDIGWRLERVAP